MAEGTIEYHIVPPKFAVIIMTVTGMGGHITNLETPEKLQG